MFLFLRSFEDTKLRLHRQERLLQFRDDGLVQSTFHVWHAVPVYERPILQLAVCDLVALLDVHFFVVVRMYAQLPAVKGPKIRWFVFCTF